MKIFIDTTSAITLTIDRLDNLVAAGCKLCFTNTVVDIATIRKNPDWFEQQLKSGTAFVECWSSEAGLSPAAALDEMTSKAFYWSSFDITTAPAMCFEAVYAKLPKKDREAVDRIARLVIDYGLPKGSWPMGQWTKPTPISAEDAKALGVDPDTATRTEILAAARKTMQMDVYSRYNVGYCTGIARQHCCQGILNSNGTISVLPPA